MYGVYCELLEIPMHSLLDDMSDIHFKQCGIMFDVSRNNDAVSLFEFRSFVIYFDNSRAWQDELDLLDRKTVVSGRDSQANITLSDGDILVSFRNIVKSVERNSFRFQKLNLPGK